MPSCARAAALSDRSRRAILGRSAPPAVAVLLAALSAAAALSGCAEETTGQCCTTANEEARAKIPVPDRPEGSVPRDVVRSDVRFDCEEDIFCASVKGSEPVCTRKCTESTPCPDGFDCAPLIESDPGPMSNIRPGDQFCVRKACGADTDCPDDWKCETVYEGRGTPEDPVIRQCVKPEHKCE